ncbi:hypothetical protein AKO1_005356 [Acrasis kona]|uniref:Fe2OG dioxygenase domain-containing protein n=1 Tax=Acrasis kona TaxID=1008807 RepID=A0AAW2YLS1_9EUKA
MAFPMNYGQVNVGHIGGDRPVDAWHIDSLDFVMVMILSDMSGADGGELQVALKDAQTAKRQLSTNGELASGEEMMTVAYPGAGYAIFMQGAKILHRVTAVKSAKEPRISMVNSYMRTNVFGADNTKFSMFEEIDPKHVAAVEFARQKSWRVKGMMDYIINHASYGEDRTDVLNVLNGAIEELTSTRELLAGRKNDAVGYFDEKTKSEAMRMTEPKLV